MDVAAVREAAQTLRVIGEQRFDQGIRLFQRQCGPGARFGRGNPGSGVLAARETMDRAIAEATALGWRQAMTAAALSTTIELIASMHAAEGRVTVADLDRVSALLTQASAMAGSAARALGPDEPHARRRDEPRAHGPDEPDARQQDEPRVRRQDEQWDGASR